MTKTKQSIANYILGLCDGVLGQAGLREYTFDWLRGDVSPHTGRSRKQPVDSYWPALNLVVEVYERQHDEPVAIMDRRDTISGVTRGIQRRIYDERRVDLLPKHGIDLVVIRPSALSIGPRGTHIPRPDGDRRVVEQTLAPFIDSTGSHEGRTLG